MKIQFKPTIKQDQVFNLFNDETTTEILFGGAVSGGKSFLLTALAIIKCLEHPTIRIGLARNELSNLKKTTMVSFFEVCEHFKLEVDKHYTFNSTAGIVKFFNGSEIILMELAYKPSDPLYSRLGGHLLTFGLIDELSEIDEIGYNYFKSRCGRWKNDQFNIKPIVISTCNPAKNWLYKSWYQPFENGTLEPHRKFIQALPQDNHYIGSAYLDNINQLPLTRRKQLLGDWNYENDKTALCTYDDIINCWDNIPTKFEGTRYITADIAFSKDKCVILVWDDWNVIHLVVNPVQKVQDEIRQLQSDYNIKSYNVIYDSQGVGHFIKQEITNAKAFIANAKPFKNEQYKSLKAQCQFKLADKINDNELKICVHEYQQDIIDELSTMRYKESNQVGKVDIVDKATTKRVLGHSPDFLDSLMMRSYFDYKSYTGKPFRIG